MYVNHRTSQLDQYTLDERFCDIITKARYVSPFTKNSIHNWVNNNLKAAFISWCPHGHRCNFNRKNKCIHMFHKKFNKRYYHMHKNQQSRVNTLNIIKYKSLLAEKTGINYFEWKFNTIKIFMDCASKIQKTIRGFLQKTRITKAIHVYASVKRTIAAGIIAWSCYRYHLFKSKGVSMNDIIRIQAIARAVIVRTPQLLYRVYRIERQSPYYGNQFFPNYGVKGLAKFIHMYSSARDSQIRAEIRMRFSHMEIDWIYSQKEEITSDVHRMWSEAIELMIQISEPPKFHEYDIKNQWLTAIDRYKEKLNIQPVYKKFKLLSKQFNSQYQELDEYQRQRINMRNFVLNTIQGIEDAIQHISAIHELDVINDCIIMEEMKKHRFADILIFRYKNTKMSPCEFRIKVLGAIISIENIWRALATDIQRLIIDNPLLVELFAQRFKIDGNLNTMISTLPWNLINLDPHTVHEYLWMNKNVIECISCCKITSQTTSKPISGCSPCICAQCHKMHLMTATYVEGGIKCGWGCNLIHSPDMFEGDDYDIVRGKTNDALVALNTHTYCCNQRCSYVIELTGDNKLKCLGCKIQICESCKQRQHDGECSNNHNEMSDELLKKLDMVKCPQCNAGITKNGGCSLVRCCCGFTFDIHMV
uniref:RING-type domain-containing protein n=1 Tax=Megaviridae environmental sample TaxID=1737588 RepID=A0A5J6VIK6_9VIRU|nr:MAG: hypothetical protein [Megaviridae environmental sample]